MNITSFEGKILLGKNGRKCGQIVMVKKTFIDQLDDTEKNSKITVRIERPLRDEIGIEIDAKMISHIDGNYALLDITKKEFLIKNRNMPKVQLPVYYKNC